MSMLLSTRLELESLRDALVPWSRVVSYPKKATVFRPGDDARWLGIVLEGELSVRMGNRRQEIVVASLGALDLIGPAGVFGHRAPRSVSLRCDSDAQIALIDYVHLDRLLETSLSGHRAGVYRWAGSSLADRMASVRGTLSSVVFNSVDQRILDALSERSGAAGSWLRVSRAELGRCIGASRETVTRALQRLAGAHAIEVKASLVRLLARNS